MGGWSLQTWIVLLSGHGGSMQAWVRGSEDSETSRCMCGGTALLSFRQELFLNDVRRMMNRPSRRRDTRQRRCQVPEDFASVDAVFHQVLIAKHCILKVGPREMGWDHLCSCLTDSARVKCMGGLRGLARWRTAEGWKLERELGCMCWCCWLACDRSDGW